MNCDHMHSDDEVLDMLAVMQAICATKEGLTGYHYARGTEALSELVMKITPALRTAHRRARKSERVPQSIGLNFRKEFVPIAIGDAARLYRTHNLEFSFWQKIAQDRYG